MQKLDYLKLALNGGASDKAGWVISLLARFEEPEDKWRTDPYPYRIVHHDRKVFYVNPLNPSELLPIDGAKTDEPLFSEKDPVDLTSEHCKNIPEGQTVKTLVGNWILNQIVLVRNFGALLPFQTGRVKPGNLEKVVAALMVDDPEEGETLEPGKISCSQYVRFVDSTMFMTNFMQLVVPGESIKSLTTHPEMNKRKAQLIEENKGKLHDPEVMVRITKELTDLDREWLKDDEVMGLYINDKQFDVIRKKMYCIFGHQASFGDMYMDDPVIDSLSEGWNLRQFPQYNDDARSGSYDRGKETQLGGEGVKWLARVAGQIMIRPKDCRTKRGISREIKPGTYKKYLGFSYIAQNGEPLLFDEETAQANMGKRMVFRSMQYCALPDGDDRCTTCAGPRLAENPESGGTATMSIGDGIMYAFMSSMHGRAVKSTAYDFNRMLN